MDTSDVRALLTELAAPISPAPEVGVRGQPPHDYAYVKLTSASNVGDYAVVSTPGVNWFELEVAGGFRTGRADDLATDKDVREYLEEYLRVAIAYLSGNWSTGSSRVFRVPFVTVKADGVDVKLMLPVRHRLRHIFKWGR